MKFFKYVFFLVVVTSVHWSCEDDFSELGVTEAEVTVSADDPDIDLMWDRASYDESVSQMGQSLARDERQQPSADALQLVYDYILEENTTDNFLNDMIGHFGWPAWSQSTIVRSHDSDSYYISLPWVRSGAFTGVLQFLYIDDQYFAGFVPKSSIDVDEATDGDPEDLSIVFMAVMDLIYFEYRIDDVFDNGYFEWLKTYSEGAEVESRSPSCSGYVNYTCSPCLMAFADECCYVTSWDLVCYSPSGGPWNGGVSGGVTSGSGSSGGDGGGASTGDGGVVITEVIDPDAFAISLTRARAIRQYRDEMGIDMDLDEVEALIGDCVNVTRNDGSNDRSPFVGYLDEDCVADALVDRLAEDLNLSTAERTGLKTDHARMWDLIEFLDEHREDNGGLEPYANQFAQDFTDAIESGEQALFIDDIPYFGNAEGVLQFYLPPIDLNTATTQVKTDQILEALRLAQTYFCIWGIYRALDWSDYMLNINFVQGVFVGNYPWENNLSGAGETYSISIDLSFHWQNNTLMDYEPVDHIDVDGKYGWNYMHADSNPWVPMMALTTEIADGGTNVVEDYSVDIDCN